ncbi:hypothetical protein SESBI_01890 [Sesbania bispinosa]|nr:hypothetical protein SESBI_01890 [Sesbania bispinosa]
MSAKVEVWMGELAKLSNTIFSKAKEGSELKEKAVEKEAQKGIIMAVQRDTATISEETVCLLMDRFVPC